jgi:hypothetical protein
MFFELQHGRHLEGGVQYATKYEPDDEGKMQCVERPIVESHTDLVERFGPEKFRRLADSEVQDHLKKLGRLPKKDGGSGKKDTTEDSQAKSDVAKAAEEGAKDVLEPPGKDVTDRFPGASSKGLKIFRRARNEYLVMSVDEEEETCLTEEPITKGRVEKLLKEWTD